MAYNPNQPRDPKGTSTGGQWTSELFDLGENAARKRAGLPMRNIGKIEDLKKMLQNPQDFIDFLKTKIEDDFEGSVGLRGLYKDEKTGKLRRSATWDDGNRTDEILDGTSIVGLSTNYADENRKDLILKIQKYLSNVFSYGDSKRVGLVIGDSYAEYGNDYWANELIVKNAKVIYIWE